MIKKIVTLITLLIYSSTITPSSLLRYCCGVNRTKQNRVVPIDTYRSVTPTPRREKALIMRNMSDSLDSSDRRGDYCFKDMSRQNSADSIQNIQLEGLYDRVSRERPIQEDVIDLGNGAFKIAKKK